MILALTESAVPLSVKTLGTLLVARYEREKMETYKDEMLCLIARANYTGVVSPGEYYDAITRRHQKPVSGKKIISTLIDKLKN